jgi:hypothetical protein
MVFQGDRRSRRTSDFVPASEDKRLSMQQQQAMSRMRIAEPSGPATAKTEIPASAPMSAKTPTAPASRAANTKPAPPVDPGSALGFAPESMTKMRGFGFRN